MENVGYNNFYLSKLWIATITITPLLAGITGAIVDDRSIFTSQELGNIFQMWAVMSILGFFFSLPAAIVVFLIYVVLDKEGLSVLFIKISMICLTVIGIFVSFYVISLIFGSKSMLKYFYSFTAIAAGLLLRVTPRVTVD